MTRRLRPARCGHAGRRFDRSLRQATKAHGGCQLMAASTHGDCRRERRSVRVWANVGGSAAYWRDFGVAIAGHMVASWRQPHLAFRTGALAALAACLGLALAAPSVLPTAERWSCATSRAPSGMEGSPQRLPHVHASARSRCNGDVGCAVGTPAPPEKAIWQNSPLPGDDRTIAETNRSRFSSVAQLPRREIRPAR
jgi:hypothetical protein